MITRIESHFPKLVETGYIPTSPEDSNYNCIAFTLGDLSRWWWPPVYGDALDSFWPSEAPRQESIDAFLAMYALQGFDPCATDSPEPGFAKIAVFVEPKEGLPAHAALQLPSGKWISKMWDQEDILHTLDGLNGPPHYFQVAAIIRCPIDKTTLQLRTLLSRYGNHDAG